MSRTLFLLFAAAAVIEITVAFANGVASGPRLYWLVFTGALNSYSHIGPRFLMQIDETGNVIKQPTILLSSASERTYGANALSPDGKNRLILWASKGRFSGGPPT